MKWDDAGYSRYDVGDDGNPLSFEDYNRSEKTVRGRLAFLNLTRGEMKLLLIAGVGFFLDAYDLFIINLVTPVWIDEYWGGNSSNYPFFLRGVVNAGANIGNIIGQLSFGFLGDVFGRRFVYGKELIICVIGMVMVISLPNSIPTSSGKMVWILVWRIVMGIGIGGDYPMSASITSERSHLRRRGILLGFIFSNQGWGTLAGSVVTIIVLGCFSKALSNGAYDQLDAVWRIQMGVAIVPALATLWPRLTMPEGKQFLQSQELNHSNTSTSSSLPSDEEKRHVSLSPDERRASHASGRRVSLAAGANTIEAAPPAILAGTSVDEPKWGTFVNYFSHWPHLKILIGTAGSWFLVDFAFYGTNLNQSLILTSIGYNTGVTEYDSLMKNAIGNLIIAVAGYVPGYLFTIAFVEIIGRKPIQIMGFLVTALLFGVLAGDFGGLSSASRFVCFALAQFFFNFGANSTTFIIAAEAFPSRVRGSAHGVSAAVGKTGAIIAAILFNYLAQYKIGLANTLWVFFACNVLGCALTFWAIPETMGRDSDVIDYEEWLAANPDIERIENPALKGTGKATEPT